MFWGRSQLGTLCYPPVSAKVPMNCSPTALRSLRSKSLAIRPKTTSVLLGRIEALHAGLALVEAVEGLRSNFFKIILVWMVIDGVGNWCFSFRITKDDVCLVVNFTYNLGWR